MKTLYIVRGLPGTGQDEWIEKKTNEMLSGGMDLNFSTMFDFTVYLKKYNSEGKLLVENEEPYTNFTKDIITHIVREEESSDDIIFAKMIGSGVWEYMTFLKCAKVFQYEIAIMEMVLKTKPGMLPSAISTINQEEYDMGQLLKKLSSWEPVPLFYKRDSFFVETQYNPKKNKIQIMDTVGQFIDK